MATPSVCGRISVTWRLRPTLASAESTEQLQIAEAVARVNPADRDAGIVAAPVGGAARPLQRLTMRAGELLDDRLDRVVDAAGPRVQLDLPPLLLGKRQHVADEPAEAAAFADDDGQPSPCVRGVGRLPFR